jgi:hypothetical protein
MAMNDAEKAWVFYFSLEAQMGRSVSYSEAEQLLDQVIAWVEERGLQIGGGFRAPTEEESNPEPFPLRGHWNEGDGN